MTDILPKNPHPKSYKIRIEPDGTKVYPILLHIGWQQGQDETMKALRPMLRDAFGGLSVLLLSWPLDEKGIAKQRVQEAYDKIEQILKERE